MIRRVALSLVITALGIAAILGARFIPMAYVAPVVVAAGCMAVVVAGVLLWTLASPPKTADSMCLITVVTTVLAGVMFEAIMPFQNKLFGVEAQLWDPTPDEVARFATLRFTHNAQGWRTGHNAGAFRASTDIILVGDSRAVGIVNDEDTIEAQLRRGVAQREGGRNVMTTAVPEVGPIVYEVLSDLAPSTHAHPGHFGLLP